MKKIYTFLIAMLAMSLVGFGQNFNVTFQVDMTNQTVGDTVSVAGSFQAAAGFPADWTPGATVLTDGNGDDIYDLTVQIPAGTYEYKFINGTAWGQDESVPGACASGGGNREVTVSADVTIPVVEFGACPASGGATDTVMVTFQVDMTNETAADSVTIAGSFQGSAVGQGWSDWTPGISVLEDPDMDNIYTLTVMLPAGNYEYKYVNGVAWGSDEAVPSGCAPNGNGNRAITVAGPGPIVIPVHCFASCDTCVPPLPPINVTFRVDMTGTIISSNGLTVAGNFQDPAWDKDALPMTDANNDNIYEFTQSIVPAEYAYKYFNGGSMDPQDGEFGSTDPGPCATGNGLGGFNRVLNIVGATADTILPVFEYNSCNSTITSLAEELSNEQAFTVFPNPMSQNATVMFADYNGQAYDLSVRNMLGQTVYNRTNVRGDQVEISNQGWNAGIYFLEVRFEDQKVTRKVIVE